MPDRPLSTGRASRLVTRREAAQLLGYASAQSLKAVMQQQPEKWPAPVASRLHGYRSLLWDLDELDTVVVPGTQTSRSRRPDGADYDGLVTCLSCGRRFRSLGPHLLRAHQITAAEYRAEHRLPASVALMARSTRASLSTSRRQAITDDPDLVSRMRGAAIPLPELARRSAEARAETDDLPAVQAARRRGGQSTIRRAQQARRQQIEQRAQAAGFVSMMEAVKATRSLTVRDAATRIGIGESTVKRWRRKNS